MSTNLYWRPAIQKPNGHALPNTLKYMLGPRYFGHDGTLGSSPVLLGDADRAFLEGIRAGRTTHRDTKDEVRDGIDELLAAIAKYDTIELWTEM
jgi:hypothetical protein